MSIYPEAKQKAVSTQSAYIGIKDISYKIIKMYIGVNGKAELFYGDSGDNDTDINENAIYFYNEGNECTDVTGGWEVWETDTSELCTHTKRSNCLEIACDSKNYLNTKTIVNTGFKTTNLNVSLDDGYRIGVQYSFTCDIINDSNYYFTIDTLTSGNGGTVISSHITANSKSEEIVKTLYINVDDYGMSNILINFTLWDYNNEYHPNAKLKIYKIWYEPNEN